MDGAHDPSGALAKGSDDGNAPVPSRDCKIGGVSLELRAGVGSDALERRPEQPRLQMTELIVVQPFLLELHPQRFGERKHLVIIAPVRSEQSPDPHLLVDLVVHGDGGH